MTVSIGVVTNERRRFTHAAQVSALATEMKSYAKTLPGSVFSIDRRTDSPPPPDMPGRNRGRIRVRQGGEVNVSCPECQSVFRVDPSKVPAAGVRARCSVCGGVITVGAGCRSTRSSAPTRRERPEARAPATRRPCRDYALTEYDAPTVPFQRCIVAGEREPSRRNDRDAISAKVDGSTASGSAGAAPRGERSPPHLVGARRRAAGAPQPPRGTPRTPP